MADLMTVPVDPAGAAPPHGSYSRAIAAGGLLYVSGQVATRPDGTRLDGSFGDQVDLVLDNVHTLAAAAGTSLAHAVKLTCFLESDGYSERFDTWNDVCARRLQAPYPARTTVPVHLPSGLEIEVDAVIWIPRTQESR